MLGTAVPPVLPADVGAAGTIAAIIVSVVLLVGVAVWIWVMARRTRPGTDIVEFPTRSEREAA